MRGHMVLGDVHRSADALAARAQRRASSPQVAAWIRKIINGCCRIRACRESILDRITSEQGRAGEQLARSFGLKIKSVA
jgi:hypothetical protein